MFRILPHATMLLFAASVAISARAATNADLFGGPTIPTPQKFRPASEFNQQNAEWITPPERSETKPNTNVPAELPARPRSEAIDPERKAAPDPAAEATIQDALSKAKGSITVYAAGNYRLRRKGEFKKNNIELIIPKGATFQVLGKEGEWYRVSYNGKEGYVYETGITHPLAAAIRSNQNLKGLARDEAAVLAACVNAVEDTSQIPQLQEILEGIQVYLNKNPAAESPAPRERPRAELDVGTTAAPKRAPKAPAPVRRGRLPVATEPGPGALEWSGNPANPPDRRRGIISPFANRNVCITGGRRFGCYRHPILGYAQFHSGIDLQAPAGSPVVAPLGGCKLIDQRPSKKTGGYGNQLRMQCGSQMITYSHLSRFAPPKAVYAQGEVVAFVGSTGRSTGNHLHLEVLENGHRLNPVSVFGLKTFCNRIKPENKQVSGCGRGQRSRPNWKKRS